MEQTERRITVKDDNVAALRAEYPDGLHFVVGDTHGETLTLKALMEKIRFDPERDHVYFLGDYNGGGNVGSLLEYISLYYREDYRQPGFHLIRGNHERDELYPVYKLDNLPDAIVLRGERMNYFLAHAGMVRPAFELFCKDMAAHPDERIFAYRVGDECVQRDAPLRQLIWSRNGLYSQKSSWHNWPDEYDLWENRACILHGHSPYCYFKHDGYYSYGEQNLFWENQHIYFSQSLQSFNLDANVKGRYANGENTRKLSCVCLEVLEEIAAENYNRLTAEGVKKAKNFVFSADRVYGFAPSCGGDVRVVTSARPAAKRIGLDGNGRPVIVE